MYYSQFGIAPPPKEARIQPRDYSQMLGSAGVGGQNISST